MDKMCSRPYSPFRLFILALLFSAFSFTSTFAQPDGEALYKQNCASCHSLGTNKLTGPGLEGVTKRVPAGDWLHKWIKNSDAMIKSGDAYANKIFQENGGAQMTVFTFLKDEEIDAIIKYISAPPKAPVATATADKGAAAGGGEEEGSNNSIFILLILATVLFILWRVLKGARKSLEYTVNEKYNRPHAPEYGWWEGTKVWILTHKKHVAVILIFLVLWGSKVSWDAMASIGIYEGYAPEQPINFSHKIHAGENSISCQYCHSSAEKGKMAGVPSANVCMNCHKGIQSGAQTGSEEIAKIYKALDYDPNTQKYGSNPIPIKWVRVHNLPDHAYFNHSQHVVAGKVECQTCHGPVQEMDVVKQHSPLTMQWCIDCHRVTEVKMEGNEYYKELHAKLAEQYKGQKITVSKMGGIECGKCHY